MRSSILTKLGAAVDPKLLNIITNRISKIRSHGSPPAMIDKTVKQLDNLKDYYRKTAVGSSPNKSIRGFNPQYRSKSKAFLGAKKLLRDHTDYNGKIL